jgi:hypothetical protein
MLRLVLVILRLIDRETRGVFLKRGVLILSNVLTSKRLFRIFPRGFSCDLIVIIWPALLCGVLDPRPWGVHQNVVCAGVIFHSGVFSYLRLR